ncbi:MAG: hypothetical protein PWQ48_1841 [Thermotogaceae bacterium]|nr:hypothetical protein [Thermotogaceae bacterium]
MIKVTIDGVTVEYSENNFSTFWELWEEIKPKDRVVAELKINGQKVPVNKIEELFSAEFEGNEVIEVKTQSINQATLELIDEALGYIVKIEAKLPELSDKIIMGKTNEAMSDLKHVIDGITALESMRESISRIIDIGFLGQGHNFNRFQESLEILKKINASLLEQNFTDLVEILDSGLPKVFEFYKSFLNHAKDELISKRGENK